MSLRSHKTLIGLPILLLFSLTAQAWGDERKPRVKMVKTPGTTEVTMTVDGEIDAPPAAVQALLCDYEAHHTFSEVNERSAVLSVGEAQALQASAPKDRATIETRVAPGKNRPACPGSTYVLILLDFPFPVNDGWGLSNYEANVTGDTFQLTFDTIIGSDKGAGSWTVTPVSATRSHVVMLNRVDMGIALPEFLLKWAVSSQMPAMLKALEREAKKRVR